MREGSYTKEEVGRVLGLNITEFEDFITNTISLIVNKECYSFTELILLNKLKKFC